MTFINLDQFLKVAWVLAYMEPEKRIILIILHICIISKEEKTNKHISPENQHDWKIY